MALSTYSDLVASVKGWLARGDALVIDRIPDFIALGEERIFNDLRVLDMVKSAPFSVVAGTNSFALPDDFLEFDTVGNALYPELELDTVSFMARDNKPGRPDKYAIQGRRLVYGQTVSATTAFTGVYYAKPAAISVSNPTNWLLTKAPSVYLYAALCDGYVFVKNPDEAARCGQLLDKAVQKMNSESKAAKTSGGRLRRRGSQ